MWTVQEAKAKLSEVLKRAKQGEPQVIGAREQFVVLSQADYLALRNGQDAPHLGRWLVDNAPRGFELELPSREDDRPDPFAWFEEVAKRSARSSVSEASGRKARASRKRRV